MLRLLRITAISPTYTRHFFDLHPELTSSSYAEIKQALDDDKAATGSAYAAALRGLGYETADVLHDVAPLQRRWARERGIGTEDLRAITVEQAKAFRPDVLWFDSSDGELAARLRSALPNLRLALGWEGSALSRGGAWPFVDYILSCAPESVDRLRALGYRSSHLRHAFDASIPAQLKPSAGRSAVSFAGSLIRRQHYHLRRDALLVRLRAAVPLEISTPGVSANDYYKTIASGILHMGVSAARVFGFDSDRWPHVIRRSASPFRRPVNASLRCCCRPPVFGLRYFQTIRDSSVALNIHADSSPHYASNMRLFEVTGAGACLLTDSRQNLKSLFDPGLELVAYQSDEDCIEKARWLLDHPAECAEIAARGHRRTMAQHTVVHRVRELDELIRKAI